MLLWKPYFFVHQNIVLNSLYSREIADSQKSDIGLYYYFGYVYKQYTSQQSWQRHNAPTKQCEDYTTRVENIHVVLFSSLKFYP